MFFFRSRKQEAKDAEVERKVQAIQKETYKKIDKQTEEMAKLNQLLEDPHLGVTGMIFLATGGYRRNK